jgi:uncharacterized protein involved in type VI secretion and phage assembly
VYEYSGAYTFSGQARGDQLSKIRMEEWESRAKRFFGSGGVRNLDAGRWFELTDCPAHSSDSQQNRQFGVIEAKWFIENNLPVSGTADFPFSLKAQLDEIKAQQTDLAGGLSVPHPDGSDGFFLLQIEAQRKAIPFHSPLEHHKPVMSLQTAIVVGPANQEVYTDALNHRNGSSAKTVLTEDGPVRIDVPRDREGSFEPLLIPKHERRFTGFDDKIIAMYARGMTVREIQGFPGSSTAPR